MLSQMFEQFYAHIRHEQYLQFLENSTHFEFNYIPIVDEKKLVYEMQEYFNPLERIVFSYKTLIDIVSIPRTCVYEIDANGKFIFKTTLTCEESIEQIKEKKYKVINFIPKLEEKAV